MKVIYVSVRNTSRVCAMCGCVMRNSKASVLACCGIDRHLNAALNLLKKVVKVETQHGNVRFGLDRRVSVAVKRPLTGWLWLSQPMGKRRGAKARELQSKEVTEQFPLEGVNYDW